MIVGSLFQSLLPSAAPNTQFGSNIQQPLGLTGLDPRFVNDPRFNMRQSMTPEGKILLQSGGEGTLSTFGPEVHYLTDLDTKTVADDMWAVTLGGKQGTSVGDRATPWFIQNARDIVGNAKKVTPEMVAELKRRLLAARYGEIRQTHPGKAAYTPEGPSFRSSEVSE